MDDWHLPLIRTSLFEVTHPTTEGVEYIIHNLRPADRAEAHAAFGHDDYGHGTRLSVAGSRSCVMAVNTYGIPVALIGVQTLSVLYGVGCPWMVATDQAYAFKRAFISIGRAYTRAMLEEYETLFNHVDARNEKSIAWLRHIGYEIGPAEPYGALGLPFHTFSIKR